MQALGRMDERRLKIDLPDRSLFATSFLDHGVHTSWATLREQLSTHQVVTVVLPATNGQSGDLPHARDSVGGHEAGENVGLH